MVYYHTLNTTVITKIRKQRIIANKSAKEISKIIKSTKTIEKQRTDGNIGNKYKKWQLHQ